MFIAAIAAIAIAAPEATRAHRRALAPAAARTRGAFSRWIEDLPVMPGLTETDGGYSFEMSRGGRLAEARLHGVVDPAVVRSFYASTLPALGWRAERSQPYAYRRGRERLILHVARAMPRGMTAVFVLTPQTAPASDKEKP